MSQSRILLIDDDVELAQLLTEYLTQQGFDLICCHDGESGLTLALNQSFDLILLDVMMPKLSGFEVLTALGSQHHTPVLMLTAKGNNADRVKGLELGADDYLSKPFDHRELLARIRAILRRVAIIKSQPQQAKLSINQVELDNNKRQVSCHHNDIELTGTEFEILHCLMTEHGNIVSKQSISEQVLGRKLTPFDRSIDMHVSNIRRKFLPFSQADKIKTVRGAGYIFLTGE